MEVVISFNTMEDNEGWGGYSFFLDTFHSKTKIWGTLEYFNILKISISAKCSICKGIVHKRVCSKCCAPRHFTSSVYAIGWIQIVCNKAISLAKVLIKDNNVQQLLSIPENVWNILMEAAAEEEIVCFLKSQNGGCGVGLTVGKLLEMYCNLCKSKGKFYISVRKISSRTDEEALFFCTNLEPTNKSRLEKVADFVRKLL